MKIKKEVIERAKDDIKSNQRGRQKLKTESY